MRDRYGFDVRDGPAVEPMYRVLCPHCGKTFEAKLIGGAAPRYRGFKCPHCRLFVPYERADEHERIDRAG